MENRRGSRTDLWEQTSSQRSKEEDDIAKRQREVVRILERRIKSMLYSGSQVEIVFQEGEKNHVKCSVVKEDEV